MSVNILIFFWSLWLWQSPSPVADHAFHVSRCEIRHNTKAQSLEVTMHIFIDDLEAALKKQGHDKLFLCTEKESSNADAVLLRYLQQQFRLDINGKPAAFTYIGKEMSDDMIAAWCYLEIPKVKTVKSLLVRNKILLDVYSDQKNIIQIIVPGHRDGYAVLETSHTEELFDF